jgi:cell division transport system permease protein
MLMRRLRAIGYGLRRALDGLGKRPAMAAAVTGAIAVGFLLVGLVHLVARNLETMSTSWGGTAHMVVYMEAGATPEQTGHIAAVLERLPAVERVAQVPPEAALERLRQSMGEHEALLEGLGPDMLPASLEVTLGAGIKDVARAHPLIERLESTVGVEEVVFVGDWADKLALLMAGLRYAVWCFFALMGGACLYLVATTIRLRAQTRRHEAEIMCLIGASSAFVRGPLLVEGTIQGALGAIAAMSLLWLLFDAGADAVRNTLYAALGTAQVSFMPLGHIAGFVAAGAILGLAGSWMVTRNHGHA